MKKSLAICAILSLSGTCFADTLNITSLTYLSLPAGIPPVVSTNAVGFNPGVSKISFRIANKTCTFNSSGNPYGSGAGKGCNYSLTINNSNNTLSDPKSNGNGCTLARDMLAACK